MQIFENELLEKSHLLLKETRLFEFAKAFVSKPLGFLKNVPMKASSVFLAQMVKKLYGEIQTVLFKFKT